MRNFILYYGKLTESIVNRIKLYNFDLIKEVHFSLQNKW